MTVLASEIITTVRAQLVDTDVVQRWSDEDLLRYITDAQRAIAAIVPAAANRISSVKLVDGTRQSLPSDGQTLLSVVRNMGAAGATPGRAVRMVQRDLMDANNPDWHADTATSVVKSAMFDPQDQLHYFVHPPVTGDVYVEINYAIIPPAVTATGDSLTVADIYRTPVVDYTLYRAHQKDSDFAAGQSIAAGYLQSVMSFLTGRTQAELSDNPNQAMGNINLGVKGGAK